MKRKLLQRVRTARTGASRTSSGRGSGAPTDGGFRYRPAGHGGHMPSQRATTRMQRPY